MYSKQQRWKLKKKKYNVCVDNECLFEENP
jgi:hypothetical protein